jgi:hypothetical protein
MKKSSASQKDTMNLKVTYGKQDLSTFFVENLARALKLGNVQVNHTGMPGAAEEAVKSYVTNVKLVLGTYTLLGELTIGDYLVGDNNLASGQKLARGRCDTFATRTT